MKDLSDASTGERLLRLTVATALFQGILLAAAYDWGRDSERRRHDVGKKAKAFPSDLIELVDDEPLEPA